MPTRHRPANRPSFHFWTKGEIARVGAIAGVALVPLSIAALSDGRSGSLAAHRPADVPQPGHVRSVRIVSFDFGKLGVSSMGDVDETHR